MNVTTGLTPAQVLPPELYRQIEISRYVGIGFTGAIVFDVLNNLVGDAGLLRDSLSLPTITYIFSRLSTLALVLVGQVYTTSAMGPNCFQFQRGFSWLYPASVASTTLLFFFRIRAVYFRAKVVISVFFVLWLGVLGSTAASIVLLAGANIGPTDYCITLPISKYAPVASIYPIINDTLVFLAITFRLTQLSFKETDTVKTGVDVYIFGQYLPRLSQAMLKDGQKYFLITVTSNLTALALVYAPLPPETRIIGAIPNVVVVNIMACAAFRNLKAGFHGASTFGASSFGNELPLSYVDPIRRSGTMASGDTHGQTRSLTRASGMASEYRVDLSGQSHRMTCAVGIEVQKEVVQYRSGGWDSK